MRRSLPSLLALALTVLLLAACGDSDDGSDETTTTSTSAPSTTTSPQDTTTTSSDGTGTTGEQTEDALADQLVAFGLEEEEATCLAGELAEGGLDASAIEDLANDPSQLLSAVQACDIPISRVLELAGGLLGGSGSDPAGALAEAITAALGSDRVSEEEAQCIADELVAQGRDISALADLESLGSVLEGCGVSVSDVAG